MLERCGPPLVPPEDNAHEQDRSYLRQIYSRWLPTDAGEAKAVAEECLLRAEELSSVLTDYAAENRAPLAQFQRVLGLLEDLIYFGYYGFQFWPEAQGGHPHA